MAKSEKRKIGDVGEEVACKYYINKGFSVRERNYWRPWGEIDIVVEDEDKKLRFVEVKSVSRVMSEAKGWGVGSRETFRPEENMHHNKLRRLHRVIQTYLLEKRVPESRPWQIDLACVYLDFDRRRAQVKVLENIVI